MPTGDGYGVSFSGDGTYLAVVHVNSPYLTIYRTTAKDVAQKITSFDDTPLAWMPFPRHKIGMAKEAGAIGANIKINLFPNLYNL